MKKILFLFFLFPLFTFAQSPQSILDKATSKFKSIKCLKSAYTLSMSDNGHSSSHKGCIIIQGNKYVNYLNGTTIWFNGKTMWTLVEENGEVNITEPSSSELMYSNPYHFLNSYKKDFKVYLLNSSLNHYSLQLIPKEINNDLKKIIISINKQSFQPSRIQLNTGKSVISIDINSYQSVKTYNSKSFTFNTKNYPNVDVIDLR